MASKTEKKTQKKEAATPAPIAPEAGKISKFQAFTTATIHRKDLKGAEYNPRYLPPAAKAKLRESLQRVGLVQPIVWNKTTGNIVGGHQRLSQIDALEDSSDYSLTVAVVEVDEKREKEINILLNNTMVAGEWDLEKLKELLEEVDKINTGFDEAEFMKLFGEAASNSKKVEESEMLKLRETMEAAYSALDKRNLLKDDTDFYNVVVFESHAERLEFLKEFGFEDNRYLSGRVLAQILRNIRDVKKAEASGPGDKGNDNSAGENKTEGAEKPL
jgi:hypothetical protein